MKKRIKADKTGTAPVSLNLVRTGLRAGAWVFWGKREPIFFTSQVEYDLFMSKGWSPSSGD